MSEKESFTVTPEGRDEANWLRRRWPPSYELERARVLIGAKFLSRRKSFTLEQLQRLLGHADVESNEVRRQLKLLFEEGLIEHA